MACSNCNLCILIDDDCLCHYTPMGRVGKLADFPELVNAANEYIEAYTENCNLCENFGTTDYEHDAIISDVRFKRLYAVLFYRQWLIDYGDGRPSPSGLTTPNGDSFQDFTVQSTSNVKLRINAVNERIKSLTEKFKELLEEQECTDCEEETLNCGCRLNCDCNECDSDTNDLIDCAFF